MSDDTKVTPTTSTEVVEQEAQTEQANPIEDKEVKITPDIQKVIDGAIEARLKREQDKHQKELEERERLAKLSEEERKVELQKKYETELAERETRLAISENKLAFSRKFEADGIPSEMLDYIVDADEGKMTEKYEKLKETWQVTLNKKLEERVKPTTSPQNFTSNSSTKPTLKAAY
jgi:Zn-dependent metalloprotease